MNIAHIYHRGFPNMALVNADTGSEIAIILSKATLPPDEQVKILDAIAEVIPAYVVIDPEDVARRTIAIHPTYFRQVEQILSVAGGLDLIVKFTKRDTTTDMPFITEVTVNQGKSDDAIDRVRRALTPIMPTPST